MKICSPTKQIAIAYEYPYTKFKRLTTEIDSQPPFRGQDIVLEEQGGRL